MRMYRAHVSAVSTLTSHMRRVTLAGAGLDAYATTGIPDEYVRLQFPGADGSLVLPEITDDYRMVYPEGVVQPEPRVYTISDVRVVDGAVELDVDIALHDVGVGSAWARSVTVGDAVGVNDAHGLYGATGAATWQLLVCDLTGVPALARILRGLTPEHTVTVVVVVTDAADVVDLPSPARAVIDWVVVADDHDIPAAIEAAVRDVELPSSGRYVWVAGEARASRGVRKYLRRELGWPQSDFYTCGYWQIEAEKWNARYEKVAAVVDAKAYEAYEKMGEDEGAYLDALDAIYEEAGL